MNPVPPTHEGDAFAIGMIVSVLVAFGVIALILVTIFRNASRKNDEVDDLIEEAGREEKKKEPAAVKKEPWERDGDWWKKE